MKSCPDCGRPAKRFEFHHDPPKSKIFKENGTEYFIDRDGKKKLALPNKKNRKLCPRCHRKADKEWGVRRKQGFHKKKKRTWWKKPNLTK